MRIFKQLAFPVIFLTVFILSACDINLLENQSRKSIFISDIDSNATVQIKNLEGEYIVLALVTQDPAPDLSNYNVADIMSSPFSIGKVKNSIIDFNISMGIDYWDGSGDYWVIFLLPNSRGSKVSRAYISKRTHLFAQRVTYLGNIDFQDPVNVDMDFSEFLPF